jgi:hypothetical protein
MNLYLFIYPKDQDLSDQEIWNEGRYAAAVWESCDLSALKFAQEFYAGYNFLLMRMIHVGIMNGIIRRLNA